LSPSFVFKSELSLLPALWLLEKVITTPWLSVEELETIPAGLKSLGDQPAKYSLKRRDHLSA
jgi:hypothetical protein